MNVKFGIMIADLSYRPADQFPWNIRFAHIELNQKVCLFNQIIENILCNFIPLGTVTCDDRDHSWINRKIKGLIQKKNFAKNCSFQNNQDIQYRSS